MICTFKNDHLLINVIFPHFRILIQVIPIFQQRQLIDSSLLLFMYTDDYYYFED